MSIFTGFILYFMLFWLTLFVVLPWGNRPQENVQTGNAPSAPANPRIRKKFLVTACITAIIWLVVFLMIYFNVLDFYEIARRMAVEDYGR
ncbi:MAG: DUF1467 family protein [Micavibrio sp.]